MDHKCKRCGKCCEDMGTIWMQSDHPFMRATLFVAPNSVYSDGGKCAMLSDDKECLLEKFLGRDSKPKACREHPTGGDKCQREKGSEDED